ncbi:collagenase-like [Anopheles ziemanni]|uniref:collagenase-like n=1 Tax=Anopheles coustani TaxID=139045 RepID=UPI00265874D6|nr:collagenase-like [Anopheles coustani]XP_058178005.1 collagenase-like [Anopheles ziemanni]
MRQLSIALLICLLGAGSSVFGSPVEEHRNGRVVGGELATVGQFPYAVGLVTHGSSILFNGRCAASLISANYILTAASCVQSATSAFAYIGGLRMDDASEPGRERLLVERFVLHSSFVDGGENFDVALARLPRSVTFSDRIRPIRLPNKRQVQATFAGQLGTVFGWGRFGSGISNSAELRFARAPVLTNLACRLNLPTNTISDAHMCTDGALGGPCPGDNGAPLTIVDADGVTTQIGVFSFNSILGCESDRAAVYTRMSSYLDWIGQNSDVVIREDF